MFIRDEFLGLFFDNLIHLMCDIFDDRSLLANFGLYILLNELLGRTSLYGSDILKSLFNRLDVLFL